MIDKKRIEEVCTTVLNNPAFQPRDGWTYCNWGLDLIMKLCYDYAGFQGLRANDICDYLEISPSWEKIDIDDIADTDAPIIAAQKNSVGSGHIALVLPWREWTHSGKFKRSMPIAANIGKKNGLMGVNWAFATMPNFYVRVG